MSCYCFESSLPYYSWNLLLSYLSFWVREGASLFIADEKLYFVPYSLPESLFVCYFRELTIP